jgi:ATP diphosphatase
VSYGIEDLIELMRRLRDPVTGCSWDIKQTYQTIVPSTLEEAYEVADAIEKEDFVHLKEELGDLLFQVIFYSQLGKEDGHFDFPQIVDTLVTKLVRRHPHVFPSGSLYGENKQTELAEDDVRTQWESLKQKEREAKGSVSLLADIPLGLPALTRATKLQKRAASVGFDWSNIEGPIAKVREEILEVEEAIASGDMPHIEEEIGDLLFAVVNISRTLKLDAEKLLRKANQKFETRFDYIETHLQKPLADASLEEMDVLWEQAKKTGI